LTLRFEIDINLRKCSVAAVGNV